MQAVVRELRDLGRGATGALVFGTHFLMTMETWWLAWTLPAWVLLPAAFGAVLLVLALTEAAGFRESEERGGPRTVRDWLTEGAQVMLQSFVAAYVVLALYGIVRWGEPWLVLARVGLLELVALGLGAALANRLLRSGTGGTEARPFLQRAALFALGAFFFVLHVAPSEEVTYLASQAGWLRLAGVLVAALLLGHLVLFELEFRGQSGRTRGRDRLLHWGESFVVLFLSLAVSVLALAAFGQFLSQPSAVWAQLAIVLALPAAVGGSAARVVLH